VTLNRLLTSVYSLFVNRGANWRQVPGGVLSGSHARRGDSEDGDEPFKLLYRLKAEDFMGLGSSCHSWIIKGVN
jgi:hypothetical protein